MVSGEECDPDQAAESWTKSGRSVLCKDEGDGYRWRTPELGDTPIINFN